MPELVTLKIGNNLISHIPQKICRAQNLNTISLEGNSLKSFEELGKLKRCVKLKRVEVSYQEVPCSCGVIGRVNNKSLPLKLSSASALSLELSVKCSSNSELPNTHSMSVENIPSRIIAENCKFSFCFNLVNPFPCLAFIVMLVISLVQ